MKNKKLYALTDGAITIALATVLSFIKIFELPWGGEITLLSMLPIALFSIRCGVKYGLWISFAYSLVQLAIGISKGLLAWGLTPLALIFCILLDYIGAYTVLGTAGLFRRRGTAGRIAGISLALLLRTGFHVLSGVLIWNSYGELWNGFFTDNSWLYSLLYNGSYMLPELVFTIIGAVIICNAPVMKRFINEDR
ncbi:MAG: energy-coupled thiamine transporter ThiT [Ruminiclostridium sp.]